MSIESRLAAKKRSAKARKKAKAKAAFDLALIILIPVAILAIVFGVLSVIRSKITDYSKYLTDEGYVEDYDLAKEVSIPDISKWDVTYETFKPTETELTEAIAAYMNAALPEAERLKEDDTKKLQQAYMAMLTDEFVEKYFGENLGDKCEHTAEGYRAYIENLLWENKFNNSETGAKARFLKYLLEGEGAKISSLPKKYVKNWTQITINEQTDIFEAYKKAGLTTANSVYEGFGSKKKFKQACAEAADEVVTEQLVKLAAFDQLKLPFSKELLDKYINDTYVTEKKTYDDAVEQFGLPYLALEYKCNTVIDKVVNGMKPAEDKKDEAKDDDSKADDKAQ